MMDRKMIRDGLEKMMTHVLPQRLSITSLWIFGTLESSQLKYLNNPNELYRNENRLCPF